MSGRVARRGFGDPELGWRMLRRLADRHAGYFTARLVARIGCGDRVRVALDDGSVTRADGGLLRMSDWPCGPLDEYAMWSAWFEGAAAVSHHSAAELHGLGRLRPRFVHLTADGGRVPRVSRLVVAHRVLRRTDVESVGAFLVTTPVRTVLDLAETGIGQSALDEIVADAVAIHRCASDELGATVAALPPHSAGRLRVALSRT